MADFISRYSTKVGLEHVGGFACSRTLPSSLLGQRPVIAFSPVAVHRTGYQAWTNSLRCRQRGVCTSPPSTWAREDPDSPPWHPHLRPENATPSHPLARRLAMPP